jgi:predicted nucleotidyltransferase
VGRPFPASSADSVRRSHRCRLLRNASVPVGPAAQAFPTAAHERAAAAITAFFSRRDETDAVLLVNSCARGKATRDSCLDMQVIVPPDAVARVDAEWRRFAGESDAVEELVRVGRFSDLHLDVWDGVIVPGVIDDEGFDYLEVSVGNLFVYSVPLFVRGDRFERLAARWLPFYDDSLRRERLKSGRWFVLENNLARIPWFVDRELYFQAFDRFYRAFQGFLLGLHVSRRTYPLAYNKWIREQVVENLGLPELYERLPGLFELDRFESRAIEAKATELRRLVEEYVAE